MSEEVLGGTGDRPNLPESETSPLPSSVVPTRSCLLSKTQVEAVYLYGSHASGEAWPASDVDLAVLLPPSIAKRCGHLALHAARFAVEDLLKKEVDFSNLRLCPTVLQKEVIYAGQRLYAANRHVADEFEAQVLSAYQKLNQERAEILKEGLRSGRFHKV